MKSSRTFAAALLALALGACGAEDTSVPDPAPEEPVTEETVAEPTPAPEPEVTEEDFPLPEDFAEEAREQIDETNLEDQLSALERELEDQEPN